MRTSAFVSLALGLAACGTPSLGEQQAGLATCLQGQPCTVADGCKTGTIDCASGSPTCTALVDAAEGTSCSNGRVCQAGACTGCGVGRECLAASGCQRGTVECSTGQPVCADLAPEPDGKPCGPGACLAGACAPLADAGTSIAGPDAGDGAPVGARCGTADGPAALGASALFLLAILAALRHARAPAARVRVRRD